MEFDNLVNTLYLTFAHNEYAIAFFIGMCLSLVSLIYHPSRTKVLLLIAFSTLLIGFEYEKHIMAPLMDQTLNSLGIAGESSRSATFLVRMFQKLLPFGFFSIGWGILFGIIFFHDIKKKS